MIMLSLHLLIYHQEMIVKSKLILTTKLYSSLLKAVNCTLCMHHQVSAGLCSMSTSYTSLGVRYP